MPAHPTRHRLTALLVDDDVDLLATLAEGLRAQGIDARLASDAAQALHVVDARQHVDIAVVDIDLPRIDGIELLRKLRTRRREIALPAIVLTGNATLERAIAALRIEASDFLQKPVDAAEVAHAIRNALARREAAAEVNRPAVRTDRLASLVSIRKERGKIFGEALFEDPVWEMLIDLARADRRGEELPVTSLCLVSGVSTTTALRRLDDMVAAELVERHRDPNDGRRVLVRLTSQGRAKIDLYLQRIAHLVP